MCYFAATDRLHFPPYGPDLTREGDMPVEVFERIAEELFPRAWRVALGCAAEPMIHPRFREIVGIAGRYGVPDLWFPTNLLALTEPTMEALVRSGVGTVGASIDGVTRETYEKIRVPAKWDRLLSCLETFREVRRRAGTRTPRLRIIFTWMRSNRGELPLLPEFAERQGAEELDVRFVSPTVGVDVSSELLSGEDSGQLNRELASTARDAVARGLRLSSYPEFERAEDRPSGLAARIRHRAWRWRAGLDRPELLRHLVRQRLRGCAYPDAYYVIRPNGAVSPCIYWDRDPIGMYPAQGFAEIAASPGLERIRRGLRSDAPVGSCAECGERRTALYRLRGSPPPAVARRRST
jgi:MoaA/NifB/PqqE/SkfB family radical SAM enzyme